MLYPPGVHCRSFTPELSLPVVDCCACETVCCILALPPRLCDLGDYLSVKVCKRKLAGTEDSSRHPSESTEDRPARRLRADYSVEALWESAPDILVSKRVAHGVKSGRRRTVRLLGIERNKFGNLQLASCRLF